MNQPTLLRTFIKRLRRSRLNRILLLELVVVFVLVIVLTTVQAGRAEPLPAVDATTTTLLTTATTTATVPTTTPTTLPPTTTPEPTTTEPPTTPGPPPTEAPTEAPTTVVAPIAAFTGKQSTGSAELDSLADSILNELGVAALDEFKAMDACFWWCQENIKYKVQDNRTRWVEGAYDALSRRTGDCYTATFAMKALLRRLGVNSTIMTNYDARHCWLSIQNYEHLVCDIVNIFFMASYEMTTNWATPRGYPTIYKDPKPLPNQD